MIRVRMTVDVMTNVLQQGAKFNMVEVLQGLPPKSTLVDVDWDEVLGIISYIFDIGDSDDNIYEHKIVMTTGGAAQVSLF